MATGVHSGLRTASSAQHRRPPVPNRLDTVRNCWGKLSPRARRALFLSLFLLAGVAVLGRYMVRANDPRELYAVTLLETEVREVSRQLDEWGIDHQLSLTKDNILVAPDRVDWIKQKLLGVGVPHERPGINEDSPMITKTRSEQEEARQNRISARLAEQIEGMDGVKSATVNLAIREQLFKDDDPSTASVSIDMQPGKLPGSALASSITRLVAGAVPGLEADKVSLVDSSGRVLRTQDQDPADCLQQSLQAKLDTYLEGKVQRMLDKLPGQSTITVCAEYDLSQMQVQNTDVGGAAQHTVPLVENIRNEFFNRPAEKEDVELQLMAMEPDGKSYSNMVTARRSKSDEAYTFTVHKLPRLQKISCSVLADGPLRGSAAQIEQMVKAAVGFDASRGDQCSVVFIPMAPLAMLPPGPKTGPEPASSTPVPIMLVAAAGPLGMIGILLWMGSRRVRSEIHREMEGGMKGQTIVDLVKVSSGRSPEAPTQVQSVGRLEARARQNPQELAELLKSTWLS